MEDWREERWESRSDQRKGRRMGEWRTRLSQASRRRCFLPCSVAMAASICAGRRHRHQRWFRAQGRCRGGGGELLHNLHRHRFFVRPGVEDASRRRKGCGRAALFTGMRRENCRALAANQSMRRDVDTDMGFYFWTKLPLANVIDLQYNFLTGPVPESFNNFSSLTVLQLSSLESLLVGHTNFSGTIPSSISNLKSFKELGLDASGFFGDLPSSIDLSFNMFEGPIPLPRDSGTVLDYSNNHFSSILPNISTQLRGTTYFKASRNNLSGTLKEEWFTRLKSMITDFGNETSVMEYEGDQKQIYQVTTVLTNKGSTIMMEKILRTFVFLDVSDNAFHGSIPKSMGELVLLHTLNMSHNSLTGPIPSQLGRLKQMEALDLSSNELSGVIPQELPSLDFLGMLNLSYNRLEGKIPESLHFSLFANSSFLGNDALCGPPLSKGCSNMTLPNVIPSEKKSVDVMLFLFSGIGFGLGFAIAIVGAWGIPIRRRSPARQRAL
ncbi:Os01g0160900 [Oryza sativa Japonica Group]|uniref:Os01g0160900 protein n=2 Tax=Oryza sativa subsp. japonica TaxID=39947 RepID=Q0JQH3_ORYSJ|nr:Os01g0160900 [Oryza sativa Japonica Group]|eukprot:NP_001042091.1 Os01g0160900 [Oryza sativa Japonica Group]